MHLSHHDLYTGMLALTIIGSIMVVIEISVSKKILPALVGRKLLHFTAISTCAWAIAHFDNRLLLGLVFSVCFLILRWVIKRGWMQVNASRTYGIALFPPAFAILLFIEIIPIPIIVYAVLLLGIADALAGLYGTYAGKKKIVFLQESKTWAGFGAFYVAAFFVSLIYCNDYSLHGILFATLLAILPALTELFSYKGSDNFSLPLVTAVWYLLLFDQSTNVLLYLGMIGLLAGLFAYAAIYKKWLTVAGAVAAVWMALLLYASGSFKAFVIPGLFLITGSLLSKLNHKIEEKEGRNARQVFANGLVGLIGMIFYYFTKELPLLWTAMASFCISLSDSVSSELGIYFKGKTYDIIGFKKMAIGLSGGISIMGTLAGWVGAMLLAIVAGFAYSIDPLIVFWIAMAGFFGMLIDSIIGSYFQVKYKLENGNLTENALQSAKIARGYSWCDNDTVNLLSNLLVSTLFFLLVR